MKRSGCWVLALLLAMTLARPAPAQPLKPEAIWAQPDAAVAFLSFDAAALGKEANRTRALIAAVARGLVANVTPIEKGSAVANELLRSRALGQASWRLCLLELEGETTELKTSPRQVERVVRPAKFGAVLEVFTPSDNGGHDRLLAAIEAGLSRDASLDKAPRQRTALRLNDGATGGLSSAEEPWRDVAWVSRPSSLVVAFGRGVIEKWPARGRGGSWAEHRRAVGDVRGTTVLEAFIDLNALRRNISSEFDGGGLDRLVHAWRIANDRSIMLHGRLVGEKEAGARMLSLHATRSSRAETPGTVQAIALSESTWPQAVGERPNDGWVIVFKSDAAQWLAFGLDTYQALGPTEFETTRTRWERRTAPMLERIAPRLGEWMIVKPGLDLGLSIKPATGQDRLEADLRALFVTLAPTVRSGRKGWELVEPIPDPELQGLGWRLESGAIVNTWESK